MRNIAKECYEKIFSTQKYEESNLCNTYDDVVGSMIREAKKEVIDIIKEHQNLLKRAYEKNIIEALIVKLERHLSTIVPNTSCRARGLSKEKEHNNDFKASTESRKGYIPRSEIKEEKEIMLIDDEPSPKPCPKCKGKKWIYKRASVQQIECPICNGQGFIKS